MMRDTFHAAMVGLMIVVASAATITGPIKKSGNGESVAYYGPVVVTPLSTPLTDSPDLIVGGSFTNWTDTNGTFTVTLRSGLYRLQIRPDSALLVDVPDSTNTYTLLSRITNAISYSSTFTPGNLVSLATATNAGTVYTYSTTTNPVAWTTNDSQAIADAVAPRLGFGTGTLFLTNVTSAPSAPGTGGILYVEGGSLKFVGSSGTVTTIAPP